MNLVNPDGSIRCIRFMCLIKNDEYRIKKTDNTFNGDFWKDKVWYSIDTVIRIKDGLEKAYTREELKRRFYDIRPCN